jgi:hypothetical protein
MAFIAHIGNINANMLYSESACAEYSVEPDMLS